MTPILHRRHVLRAGLILSASLVTPATRACEFFSTHLRITHPWTRASAEGDRSAVVCMRFDDVLRDDRLIGVETPVAGAAELAGVDQWGAPAKPVLDLAIAQGQETLLSEAGTHIRLLDLRLPLEAGRAYPLTLTFAGGGVIQASLSVDFARFA